MSGKMGQNGFSAVGSLFSGRLLVQNMKSIVFICLLLMSSPLLAEMALEGARVQGGLLTGLRAVHPDGSVESRVLDVERREYQIQRIDGLAKRKVTPEKRDLTRIRKENAMVKAARKRDDPRSDFLSGWIWPVTGPISGVYGSQRVLNGKPRRPHFGVDIAAPVGTPARAPADGIVTLAHPGMFFSGATLIVDHGHNLSSSFLHLDEILVKVGDRVHRGEVIARVGKSGRVTGAHLDWRMNYHAARIDPQLLVPPMDAQTHD
jgi:murein DD-endopeptidase MepM/ murein hydrolase activator NlpD